MTLISDGFPKIRTKKNLVRSMPQKSSFKGSLGKQRGKSTQILLKFEGQNLYHIYWSLWMQLSYRKSLLVICKISRLFLNTLTGDGKYSLFKRDNLTQPIQMQLSRKEKIFLNFFLHFWYLIEILNISKKKKFRNISVVRKRVFSDNKQYLNIMKNC